MPQFDTRAQLYRFLDGRLHESTGFFAAAALTNAALAELCSFRRLTRWTADSAMELFAMLGTHLEGLNLRLSELIDRGRTDLDGRTDRLLVELEQIEVERLLRRHALCNPHVHQRALTQVNRLIYCAERLPWPFMRYEAIRDFGLVFAHMRSELGRPVNFAIMGDRIRVGHTITRLLRQRPAKPRRRPLLFQ